MDGAPPPRESHGPHLAMHMPGLMMVMNVVTHDMECYSYQAYRILSKAELFSLL